MDDPRFKIKLLVHAEVARTRLMMRRMAVRTALTAIAFIFGLLALMAFNAATYFYFTSFTSPANAALSLGIVNLVMTGLILLLIGMLGRENAQEKMAREVSYLAYDELSKDLIEVRQQMDSIRTEVRGIRDSFSGVASLAKLLFKHK